MKFLYRFIAVLLVFLALTAYALLSEPSGIPVLNYHQINDKDENALTVSSSQFAAQMDYLKKEGFLFFEIGHDQGEDLRKMLHDDGRFTPAEVIRDLPGRDRVVKCQLKG